MGACGRGDRVWRCYAFQADVILTCVSFSSCGWFVVVFLLDPPRFMSLGCGTGEADTANDWGPGE